MERRGEEKDRSVKYPDSIGGTYFLVCIWTSFFSTDRRPCVDFCFYF